MINLELNINEVNLLLASLAKQPFEVSSDLIFKIRAQATPQVQQEQQQQSEAVAE
jgi:hypothetical protein